MHSRCIRHTPGLDPCLCPYCLHSLWHKFSEAWNIPLRFWSILTRQRSGSGCWFWSQHVLKVLLDRDPETVEVWSTHHLSQMFPLPHLARQLWATYTGVLFSFCCFHTFLNAIFLFIATHSSLLGVYLYFSLMALFVFVFLWMHTDFWKKQTNKNSKESAFASGGAGIDKKQQRWCVGEWCGKLLSQQPRWERKSLHGEKRWKSEWKLSRLPLWPAPLRTQRLHHKQLVGGEMWSASACGQIVNFSFFSLSLSFYWRRWEAPLTGKTDGLCVVESAYLPQGNT